MKLVIHLCTPHIGKIVTLGLKKEAVEKFVSRLGRGRVARPKPPVDLNDGVFRRIDPIHEEGVPDGGIFAISIDMDKPEGSNLLFPEELQRLSGQFFIALQQYLTRRRIENIGRGYPADDIFIAHRYLGDPGVDHLLHKGLGDLPPLLGDDLARLCLDVFRGLFPDEGIVDGYVKLAFFKQHTFDIIEVIQDELGNAKELVKDKKTKEPYPLEDKMGIKVCNKAREKGLLIRPLGNVIVLMPPLSISNQELKRLIQITAESIEEAVC